MNKEKTLKNCLSRNNVVLENVEDVEELISIVDGTNINNDFLIAIKKINYLPLAVYYYKDHIIGEFISTGKPYISLSELKERLV